MSLDSEIHKELRCQNPACDYDMRDDPETQEAVMGYLASLAFAAKNGELRHVSVSVHRAENPE